nr:MAG TPA: hypothetical protein [Caudoviricetes sp.]DAK71140.1 MAG TPA: hypothetical protein [Caudoviricetes sp.]DAY83073.1 MAG TPA: hypothetical protein [Caudoviricetes sp.]DAZ18360.1 MAG TPA: hypothetical protein [Caudoviricetes sp.]
MKGLVKFGKNGNQKDFEILQKSKSINTIKYQ